MQNRRDIPVLVIDDDPVFAASLRIVLLKNQGEWVVSEARSVAEAKAAMDRHAPDLAIVDIHLPDGTAIDVVRYLGTIPAILVTQDANEPTFVRLMDDPKVAQNIVGYLVKPLAAGAIYSIRTSYQVAMERKLRNQWVAEATSAMETERREIAQNMHDSLGAVLTQIGWIFSSIRRCVERDPLGAEDAQIGRLCADGRKLLDEAHQQVNHAITQLRPDELGVVGLHGALTFMISQWERLARDVAITASVDPSMDSIDSGRASIIFRIVQEGLTNAMRHAQPRSVAVNVGRQRKGIFISIDTKGRISLSKESYPLTVLRERASALGGRINFHVDSEQGTSALEVLIPA